MPSTAEIIDHIQTLPNEERVSIGVQILESANSEDQLTAAQGAEIENVLLDRVDGPFIPYDSGMADRVIARGMERLKQRRDAEN